MLSTVRTSPFRANQACVDIRLEMYRLTSQKQVRCLCALLWPFCCLLDATYISHFFIDEFYYLCGTQARLFEVDPDEGVSPGTQQCSIAASTDIVARITEDGAMAESIEVVDVNETSYSLFETSDAYAASQYGAIFYTHDPSSQIVERGSSYNDTVQELCLSLVQNSTYNTEEECLAFGYTGYLIQVGEFCTLG